MSNYNNQNRFKFTANPSTSTTSTSNAIVNRNAIPNANKAPINYNINAAHKAPTTINNPSRPNSSNNFNNFAKPPPPPVVVAVDDDDIDISDTELIMASQEVESQLKFTNNVHHATSNTVNIFSQMASSSLMPAPTMTSMGASTQLNLTATATSTALTSLSTNIVDELKNELKQIRTDNMAKDGEVKILREKLKKMEQDSQRLRNERTEMLKKLKDKTEEEKKGLQKQIEFKELENQFKNQEIIDLTMKCKQLESNSKKNGTSLNNTQNNILLDEINTNNITSRVKTPSTPNMAPPSSAAAALHLQNQSNKNVTPVSSLASNNNQQIIGSKGVPTKRMICQTSMSSLNGASDTENENPTHDTKRALLYVNNQYSTTANIKEEPQQLRQVTNTNNINGANIKLQPQVLQNTTNISNRVLAKPTSKIGSNGTPTNSSKTIKVTTTTAIPPLILQQKRSQILNTKSKYRSQLLINMSNCNEKILKNGKSYMFTNLFAESADFLFKFNHQIILLNKITIPNGLNLTKKLTSLYEFISINLKIPLDSKDLFGSSSTTNDQTLFVIDRIEFVSKRLNDEMLKLIHYFLCNSKSAEADNYSHKITSNLNRPINSLAIVDLLCLSFHICFDLFLLRTSYILLGNQTANVNKSELDPQLYKKLIELKEEIFSLIFKMLQSLNFSSSKNNDVVKANDTVASNSKNNNNNGTKLNSLNATNLSSSSCCNRIGNDSALSSYTTLKVLITVLDCYNKIVYLPNLNQILEADSLNTCFYLGLVDNMHGVLNSFRMLKISSNKKSGETKENEDENMISIDDLEKSQEETEQDDYEENTCLFKLFYQKLNKYFGDIIYSIESNEYRLENCEATSSGLSNSTKSTNHTHSLQNESIITTIVAGNENEEVDYKLEKETPGATVEKRLPISRSESDIFSELQSQTMPSDTEEHKKNNQQNQINNNAAQTSIASNNNTYAPSTPPLTSFSNNSSLQSYYNCIEPLQVEFLTKLITYLHSTQFFDALRVKLVSKSSMPSRPAFKQQQQKCPCYNDMLVSFLIMIDYKFNEKFINGSRFDLNEFYLSPFKSACSFLLNQPSSDTALNESNPINLTSFSTGNTTNNSVIDESSHNSNRDETNIDKKIINSKEESNKFTYLLLTRFIHVFLTLFNKRNRKDRSTASILDDYRLKNFFCLFKLADLSFDEFFEYSKFKAASSLSKAVENKNENDNDEVCSNVLGFGLDEERNWHANTQRTGIFNHLFTSFDGQRVLLKNYIESYFYPTIND